MSTVDKSTIYEINKWLKSYYPDYRVVWGPDQLEKRLGTFVKHHPIYAEITEVREVPKYGFIIPCWVLEVRAAYEGTEVKNHNFWDVCFPFINVLGERQDPDLETVQFMMKELITHDKKRRQNQDDVDKKEEKRFDQEVERIEEALSE